MLTYTFPHDIEDRIFEWAALLLPGEAGHFAVVCKRLQIRVEYIMYEYLFFTRTSYRGLAEMANPDRFKYTLGVRPAELFATRVRNIAFMYNVGSDFAQSLVAKCTGARTVAFWVLTPRLSGYGASFLPLASSLVAISASPYTVNEIATSGVVFPCVRYLGLMGFSRDPLLPLDWLPNLLTMQVDLNKPETDQWVYDTKLAISTAPFLEMVIFDVDPDWLHKVKPKRPELGDEAGILFRNREAEHIIFRWRAFAYSDDMIFD
ncbi:hypothetical protein C0993_001839 [Termitomyces sp. T159_Od127]|nr:hypothetical protein C0993_001839 [Termitomyces sp. T159_Od127]